MTGDEEVLFHIEQFVSGDLVKRLQGEQFLWSQQYDDSYLRILSKIIQGDGSSFTPELKRGSAVSFRKVLSSRCRQSLNFNGGLTEDLKELIKTEFFDILLCIQPEEIKSEVKKIVLDVYEDKFVDVWFLEEIMKNAERSNKIFFELLISSTTFIRNSHHNKNDYEDLYKKLAGMFVSFIKKYLSSLPDYLEELQLLLKSYSAFVFEGVTKHMNEDVSYFLEPLQEMVLSYPTNDVILTEEQMKNLLAAKEEVLLFWSKMNYDDTKFIKNNSLSLYNVALNCIKMIPGSPEYDGIYGSANDLIEKMLTFFMEDMNLNQENIDQLWDHLVQSCLKSDNTEEACICLEEPLKYAKHVLDRGPFQIHYHKSISGRRNHLYNLISKLLPLRGEIADLFLHSVTNYLKICGFTNSDNFQDRDFYWNIINCMNYDGDDDSYDNREKTCILPCKMADVFIEAIELLSSANVHPLLQCDALKFIILQRKQFSVEELNGSLDVLIELLTSQYPSVTSFAGCALQRIIYLKDEDEHPIINNEILLEKFPILFENVAKSLAFENNKGNPFVIDALREAISNLSLKLVPLPLNLLMFLREQVLTISEMQQVDVKFNRNLFECIGHLSLISVHKSKDDGCLEADQFEKVFVPAFKKVLDKNYKVSVPFVGYIFINTILSRYKSSIPDALQEINSKLLSSNLWYDEDYTGPLMYCLKLLLGKHFSLMSPSQLESAFEICYKLLFSQPRAFRSIQVFISILESVEGTHRDCYLHSMLESLVKASKINREVSFLKGLIVFLCYAVIKFGVDKVLKLLDEIDPLFFQAFVIKTAFPVSCYTNFNNDNNITGFGLTLLLEHLAPKAVEDEETMIIWTYLIMTLADISFGYALERLIGDINSDDLFRSIEQPLNYDYYSDLRLDGDWEHAQAIDDETRTSAIGRLKETLEKYPRLCSSNTFSSLNFDLKVRSKLKRHIRKNTLPEIPSLTYPGDPEEEESVEDDYSTDYEDEKRDQETADENITE